MLEESVVAEAFELEESLRKTSLAEVTLTNTCSLKEHQMTTLTSSVKLVVVASFSGALYNPHATSVNPLSALSNSLSKIIIIKSSSVKKTNNAVKLG